jgi:hypothetical protein
MTSAAPSARGLFRATGKTATHVVRTLDGYERTAEAPRETHDFYPTPAEVTRALLYAEGHRIAELSLPDDGWVWEPAAGDGAMVRELQAIGLRVHRNDIVDRGCGAEIADFLAMTERRADVLITNPPYNLINARDGKGQWLTHAMDLGCRYVALFLNWDWPCAAGLAPILARHPISRAYACRWKVDFTGKGAPPQRNGWFIWDADWQGETAFRLLDRNDARQVEMFP